MTELPLPDFGALQKTDGPQSSVRPLLKQFSLLLLWLASMHQVLRVELDCLLATLPALVAAQISQQIETLVRNKDKIRQIPPMGEPMTAPSSLTKVDEQTKSDRPLSVETAVQKTEPLKKDYECEYGALQVLFEAISEEAEQLRQQLVRSID